ncbi:penicillin-binding protein [Streptomyces qinglanensis]|uniref:Penicillin-binding protein n=1 Tax=Streptomyces qinglanensis TaxID=943816 RepID=A0A1E7K142_9ACTN|nr:transglycosylase domain-containing protein [Streptomyces qinglanensis]OEU97620.1 penicillin-binding protein [Streptomyces qinglanensis]
MSDEPNRDADGREPESDGPPAQIPRRQPDPAEAGSDAAAEGGAGTPPERPAADARPGQPAEGTAPKPATPEPDARDGQPGTPDEQPEASAEPPGPQSAQPGGGDGTPGPGDEEPAGAPERSISAAEQSARSGQPATPGTPASPREPEPDGRSAPAGASDPPEKPAPPSPADPAATAAVPLGQGPAGDGPASEESGSLMANTPEAEQGKAAKKANKAMKKQKRRRTGWRRLLPTWRMVLGAFLLVVLAVSGALVAGYLLVSIPAPNEAAAAQTNVYLYADGSQIARDGDINRENVTLGKVPKTTQHAVLAAEDRDFYHESAVDPQAMARAGWNMVTGGERQSGSTITQQYVKNYYLSQDQTVTRKAKEFFIALKLDNEVSKNDILQGYLNTSYFGRNAYGIQSAAHAYYGKEVGELTAGEGAYLAALVNSPNAYDTRAHPESKDRAVARWNYVLDGMVKEGWLSKSDRTGMKFPEPHKVKPPRNLSGERGYLVDAVKNYLIGNEIIDERRLAAGGFRITTTFQPKKQKAMRDAVDDELMAKLDRKNRKVDSYVRAGGASVDPKTGKVVAMYGGIGYTKQYTNNATRRDYQVGSTFKPFLFTSAVQNRSTTQDGRLIRADTVYDGTNKREVVSDGRGTGYAPANEDQHSYGKIPVSTAMDKSVNSVFAQMGIDVGPKNVKETAIDLGIPKDAPNLTENGSIALGVTTASVLDMAEAYATLANHGKHGHYSMVEKATRGGEVISLPDPDPVHAVPREAADSTTATLRSVVQGGTGTAAQAAGRPAAGKTGTAEEDKAAWFAGYTPDLSTVVSVMGQNPKTAVQEPLYGTGGRPRVNGGGFPTQIWAAYTKKALEGRPAKDFDLDTAGKGNVSPSQPPFSTDPSGQAPSDRPSDEPSKPAEPSDRPSTPSTPPSRPPSSPPQSPPATGGADSGGSGDPGGGDGVVGGNGNGGPGGDAASGDPGGL